MKEEGIDLDGIVSEVLPSAMFRVALDNGHKVLATTAGKMRKFKISRARRRSSHRDGLAL